MTNQTTNKTPGDTKSHPPHPHHSTTPFTTHATPMHGQASSQPILPASNLHVAELHDTADFLCCRLIVCFEQQNPL